MKRLILSIFGLCLAVSSVLGEDARTPLRTPVPDGWNADSIPVAARDTVAPAWKYEPPATAPSPSLDAWWQLFDDPVLTRLIEMGEKSSYSLKIAMRRIEMARQGWLAAQSGWYPQIGVSAGWTKERTSGDTSPVGSPMKMSYFSLGLNCTWEIDVFGRTASAVKEQKALWNASKAEYDAAMVSLAANIATAYINYLLATCEIRVAEQQIASQQKIHKITEARFETGLASKLDVAQALTVLYSTEATLPSLKAQKSAARHSIATLVGCYQDSLSFLDAAVAKLPNPYLMTEIGVPADLLRRRPDIIAAEYELASYAAALGVAKKDFLPVLSFNGAIGTSAHNARDLFSKKSFSYSIAPQLSWTIFEGLARNRRAAEAREQMLMGIDNYNLTVMTAVNETDQALAAYRYSLERIGLISKVSAESEESFTLALDRYKRGLSAFSDVMTAQINMLQYQTTLLQTKAAALNDAIRIYEATAGNPNAQASAPGDGLKDAKGR